MSLMTNLGVTHPLFVCHPAPAPAPLPLPCPALAQQTRSIVVARRVLMMRSKNHQMGYVGLESAMRQAQV